MRILVPEIVEFHEVLLVYVQFRVEDQHLPGDVAHADEGINEVRAEVAGDVVDIVAADVRPIDRPIAEVARYSGGFVT